MTNPGHTQAATLLAHPGVRQVPTERMALFDCPRFLPPDLCAELVALIERDRRPSTIANANGDDYFRTSETCDLPADHPAVIALEQRLLALTGIAAIHGEPAQGQRYAEGQEFKPHTDYFDVTGVDYHQHTALSGNRTWTCMIYLNDVDAGGGTRFKVLGKTFQPETGKLLCWNNMRPDGSCNPVSLHQGMKVRKGLKYVITKWYREQEWKGIIDA